MYDKPFFYRRRVSRYETQQIIIAGAWFSVFRPHRVFDLGCGIGSYLYGFAKLGCFIGGCDIGYDVAKEFMRGPVRRHTYKWDASQPVPSQRKADLILCLDVAEHIRADRHCAIWESFKKIGNGYVLFSGGLLHQPGCGHIACQSRGKWIQDGKAAGLIYDEQATAQALLALNGLGDPLGFMNRLLCFKVPSND